MPVEIEEIVLQARIEDGRAPGAGGGWPDAEDRDGEDREAEFRRELLSECARMIRASLADRGRR